MNYKYGSLRGVTEMRIGPTINNKSNNLLLSLGTEINDFG